jgi:hypothetical protein
MFLNGLLMLLLRMLKQLKEIIGWRAFIQRAAKEL